jgi:hypothetical protein
MLLPRVQFDKLRHRKDTSIYLIVAQVGFVSGIYRVALIVRTHARGGREFLHSIQHSK